MPSLILKEGNYPKAHFSLLKPLITLGNDPSCDIHIEHESLKPLHCHLQFDGQVFSIAPAQKEYELIINNKKKKKHALSHQDKIQIGEIELLFSMFDELHTPQEQIRDQQPHYQMLFDFSSKLLSRYDLVSVLEEMMDAVISVSNADKGFLILFNETESHIRVARNLHQENIEDATDQLSDSIIAKVIKTKKALIVSDALKDDQFANSRSIMQLNVVSVMCVPLLDHDTLLGLIYVGNDNIAELFDNHSLKLLTVFAAQASLIIKNALLIDELKLDNKSLIDKIDDMRFGRIIGACSTMLDVFKKVEKVSTTDISVLITGETGTGKELIAREIHERSSRAKGPFVTINCGAIPETLIESELFGHVKGAFTGAIANKEGKFHAANKGTLFLDEVGELPLHLQVKLLRAIQERVVLRVGGNRPESVDIRILAATNRNLDEGIKKGEFREDLYYRLNVINIHLPPLRERGDDIMVIAKYFLNRYAQEFSSTVKGFSPNAAIALMKYNWPGNIRHLENHIKKAVVLADTPLLSAEDLDIQQEMLPDILPLAQAKEKFQRDYINEILARNNGNRTKTARDLGVDPRTIFRHLEKEEERSND